MTEFPGPQSRPSQEFLTSLRYILISMVRTTGVFFLSPLLLIFFFVPLPTEAADCSLLGPGFRLTVPTDAVVINRELGVGVCYNPATAVAMTQDIEEARRFLISRYVIGPRSAPCIRTKEEGISGLKADFAVRVARMIQDMERELGGRNIVRSAYRPLACGGGVGHSNGCAVDIEYAHATGDKWRDSSDNPNVLETRWIVSRGGDTRYRLHFPFPYPPEWHHIEPMDRASCLAGRPIDPSVNGVQATPPAATQPTSALSNMMRNLFAPPPPPVIPPPPINPVYDPTRYFSTTTPPAPSTSPPSTPSDTAATPSSVSDLISALEQPKPSTSQSAATGTPVELIGTIGDVAGLRPGEKPRQTATGTVAVASLTPYNTFTSQDLSKTPGETLRRPSSTFAILETLRQTLVKLLSLLKPFGGARGRGAAHAFAEE